MKENLFTIYIHIDDIMLESGHKDPDIRNSSDYELIAVEMAAARYFIYNIDHAISFGRCTNLLPGSFLDIDRNSKMPHEARQNIKISNSRKRIETTLNQISGMLPKRLHAVAVDGLMKVIFFIFVFKINEIT